MNPAQPDTSYSPPGRAAVTRGAGFGLLAQVVDKFVPIAIILYLARVLSVEQFGAYSFILAYLAFFQIVSDYSIDTVLVRTMSQDRANRESLLRAGLGLKLLMAVTSAVIATVAVGVASGGRIDPWLMAVASLSLPTALGGAYRSYLRADMRIRGVFFIAASRSFFLGIAVVIAVRFGDSLSFLFASMAAANFVNFCLVGFALRGEVGAGFAIDRVIWRRLAMGAYPLVLNALAMTISLRVGHLLLMSMRGPASVGLLGAAARITDSFTLLPEALMISVLPLMAGLHDSGSRTIFRTAARSTRYLVLATGVPVLICIVAGETMMHILFGSAFVEGGPLLALLSVSALFAATGTVILNLLVAAHREQTLYRNTAVFAVVSICLSIVLIDSYGELGAAAAVLFTSVASQISLACLPATGPYVRPVLFSAARGLLAVGAAAFVGRTAAASPQWAVLFSLLAYVVALIGFGVVRRDDLTLARSLFSD